MNWRRLYACCEPSLEDYDSSPSPSLHPSDDEFIVHDVEPRPLQQQQELRQELKEREQELLQQQHQLQQLQEQQQRRHRLEQQRGGGGDDEDDEDDQDDQEGKEQQLAPTPVAPFEAAQAVVVQNGQGREASSRNNSKIPVQTADIGHQDHKTPPRRRAESTSRSPRHEYLDERQTRLDNRSSGSEWAHSPAATDDTRMMSPAIEGDSNAVQRNCANEEKVRESPLYIISYRFKR